jgi:hypothetical protein
MNTNEKQPSSLRASKNEARPERGRFGFTRKRALAGEFVSIGVHSWFLSAWVGLKSAFLSGRVSSKAPEGWRSRALLPHCRWMRA